MSSGGQLSSSSSSSTEQECLLSGSGRCLRAFRAWQGASVTAGTCARRGIGIPQMALGLLAVAEGSAVQCSAVTDGVSSTPSSRAHVAKEPRPSPHGRCSPSASYCYLRPQRLAVISPVSAAALRSHAYTTPTRTHVREYIHGLVIRACFLRLAYPSLCAVSGTASWLPRCFDRSTAFHHRRSSRPAYATSHTQATHAHLYASSLAAALVSE